MNTKHLRKDEQQIVEASKLDTTIIVGSEVRLLGSRLCEARERVEQLERENRWIPVSEALPVNVGEYLIVDSRFGKTMVSEYSPHWSAWKGMGSGKYITHWRPLPSPPQEDK